LFASRFNRAAGVFALVAVAFPGAVAAAGSSETTSGTVRAAAPVLLPRDDLRRDVGGFMRRERRRYERAQMRAGVVPVRGPVDYGTATNAFGAGRSSHVHNGQDMFAPTGTALLAARDGVVLEKGSDGGRGNYVALYSARAHQTYLYFHMQSPSPLAPGAHVSAGDRVGSLGCSGSCDGAHLHFEVHRGRKVSGKGIDPMPFLKRWYRLPRR
jgi:murein DD-endopeptidase MepM/ murein hydrolase activator NlpD